MTKKPFLMGAEVEYSMANSQPRTRRSKSQLHSQLLDAIRADHCWLSDCNAPSGIYLANGSRYYLDTGKHNEFSSPELFTPRQIAIYDRAAERILMRAKTTLAAQPDGGDICITKNNINFNMPDRAAWGQHEAFTCWIPLGEAATQLVPHLVSRIPYAGAGCLSSHPEGMGFELSQRARHMTRVTGVETTRDRAIFCIRAWKSSDVSAAGWTRTNLISKDSQRCSFGMYLSYGVTGLLLMIANEGHQIGRGVALKDPIAAMRTFSLDPWLQAKAALANGNEATAIDIQRVYLGEAKSHIESGGYPDWTNEVLHHWEATLDQLENDPLNLANRLDTYLKLSIFDHQLTRAGMTWNTLRRSLQILDQWRHDAPEFVVQACIQGGSDPLDPEYNILCNELATSTDLQDIRKDDLRFAVRLQALELHYHELGGLFDQMADSGCIDPVVVTAEDVEHAIHNPPAGGRAEARGKSVAEYHGGSWMCDWQHLINYEERKWINLNDPFSRKREVTPIDSTLSVAQRVLERPSMAQSGPNSARF